MKKPSIFPSSTKTDSPVKKCFFGSRYCVFTRKGRVIEHKRTKRKGRKILIREFQLPIPQLPGKLLSSIFNKNL